MSLVFSDTTNKSGIIQHIERTLGFNDGDITGNTTLFAQITSDCNLAIDNAHQIIIPASGTWNYDDSNHEKHAIMTANLISGQQDYAFSTDEAGNIVLDVLKVMAKPDASSDFVTLTPEDQQATGANNDKYASDATGSPLSYDKSGTHVFLYPTPSTTVEDGLRLLVNREGSYFTVSDTSKKPGFAGIFHKYIVWHVCDNYALMNNLSNRASLQQEKLMMEAAMEDWYGRRSRDERPRLRTNVENVR